MTLARWQRTIVDEAGNIQKGATVTVRREITGAPLASLYSDREGATPIGNPVTADADGFVGFHVIGGAYRITATKGAFSQVLRYVGIGTAAEADLIDSGTIALQQNVDAGYALTFESETSAPPSAGAIRFDNADLSAATEAYVSVENLGGSSIEDRLLELFDASRTIKDTFSIADPASNAQASWQIDGAAADGSPATYITLTISAHNGETAFTDDERVNFQPNRAGADGEDGDVPAARTLTAGVGLTGGGDLSANRTFNIDKASDANVRAATSNKVLTADHLSSAQALGALTDAATVAVDWQAFVNASLTLTANRALGNPSNVIAGQVRTLVVAGNDATGRELSFGGNYVGAATLTGITSTRRALITLYAETASRIWVSYRYQDDE